MRQFLLFIACLAFMSAIPFAFGALVLGSFRDAWRYWKQWAFVIGILVVAGLVISVLVIGVEFTLHP
jgi:hypothetical protein